MVRSKKLKVLLAGGGTGGHIYPLIAVARSLRKQAQQHGIELDIRYFGDPGQFKTQLFANGINISHITSSKWRSYFDIKNFLDIFRFGIGMLQSFWKLFWFMPDVCFSKGGPGSLVVTTVARFYTIPLVIHESDAVPGISNSIIESHARLVEIAFPDAQTHIKAKNINIVGNPIREEIIKTAHDTNETRASKIEFGLNPDEPVVLFLGGSQGADTFNTFLLEHFAEITKSIQILHQTGTKHFESHKQQYEFVSKEVSDVNKARYRFYAYFDENIGKAYAAADIVIARAGSGLIFEIAAAGKPSILIPIPKSANDHQKANAYAYERTGAAIVIEQENLLVSILTQNIQTILTDDTKHATMMNAAHDFYKPHAADTIAQDIFKLLL